MQKLSIVFAAMAVMALALPALAIEPSMFDEPSPGGPSGGGGIRTNDCPGAIIWDTGMVDDFIPPTGCSSSASAGCFINAANEGAFPADGRRIADDWISDPAGSPITHVKIWGRYNQQGYDYYLANPGALHGFCVKIYKPRPDQEPIWCPDGSLPDETAIGDIVYSEYVPISDVSVFGPLPAPALARSYNYCLTLQNWFWPVPASGYWLSVSADFDFVSFNNGVTQWFWRLTDQPWPYDPWCEASWWNAWAAPPANWVQVSVGVNLPCWAGWNASMVLYSNYTPPPTGACCDPATGGCTVTTQEGCQPPNIWQGPDTNCDPNPCEPPTPTEQKSWGSIKHIFR